jgi:hypothetical protein
MSIAAWWRHIFTANQYFLIKYIKSLKPPSPKYILFNGDTILTSERTDCESEKPVS